MTKEPRHRIHISTSCCQVEVQTDQCLDSCRAIAEKLMDKYGVKQ